MLGGVGWWFIEGDEGASTHEPIGGIWPEPDENTYEQPASSSTDPSPGGNWIRNLINRIPETYRNMIDSTPNFRRMGLETETDSLSKHDDEPIRIGWEIINEKHDKQTRKTWPHLWMKQKEEAEEDGADTSSNDSHCSNHHPPISGINVIYTHT